MYFLDGVKPNQPKLTAFGIKPSKNFAAADITKRICNMITTDLQPISIVEDAGFCSLLSFAFPEYTIPSRTAITKAIEKEYFRKKELLLHQLSTVKSVKIQNIEYFQGHRLQSISNTTYPLGTEVSVT